MYEAMKYGAQIVARLPWVGVIISEGRYHKITNMRRIFIDLSKYLTGMY